MKKRALLLLALAGCATAPADVDQPRSLVETLRDVCLETGMDRDAFRSLAVQREWEPLLRIVRAGDPVDADSWELVYRTGETTVAMFGDVSRESPSAAASCAVMAPLSAGDGRSEVERLAAELRMQPTDADTDAGVLEVRAWSNDDASPSDLIYERFERVVVVSLKQPADY